MRDAIPPGKRPCIIGIGQTEYAKWETIVERAWDEGTGGQLLPRFRLLPTDRRASAS